MKFGEVRLADAEGSILAHSIRTSQGRLKKGTRIDQKAIAMLLREGHQRIVVAGPEPGDISEDDAARQIANAIIDETVLAATAATGRVNLYAQHAGVFVTDPARIMAINSIDEAMTVATLPPFSRVSEGQMIATVKIIPFMVPTDHLGKLQDLTSQNTTADLRVVAFRTLTTDLILTCLPGDPKKLLQKRRDAVADRLDRLGGRLRSVVECDHTSSAVASHIEEMKKAGSDLILVFGASAIVDRGDVIPAGLKAAGGEVLQLGMPVDPGNLLMYGEFGTCQVIGVPSCAASIKENGFDWVLERALAGLPLDRQAFVSMACGGLLSEIPSRPQPRENLPKP